MTGNEPTRPGLALQARDVRVQVSGGRTLLSISALTVAPGVAVGVRGPSGAGKTTLLQVLAGLLTPGAGSVRWGDTDLATLPEAGRARFRRDRLGLIFQDFLLFEELDAAANAAILTGFAPRAERAGIAARGQAALVRLGLGQAGGRRVDSFSGGERQRIAVARALANDPAILLADEPTASLDRAAADRLIADLVACARDAGKTLIVVSHDAALQERMDRVIDIEGGRIVGDSDG